jgi:group I intron endonuclease
MASDIDISCETAILTDKMKVYGLIYEMTNTSNNMKYVGQTVSHRKNKDRYRPFGIMGRFKDHINEAINNTKKCQCSYLNNAIRKYGKDTFIVELIEICILSDLDEREQHFIKERNTIFPLGYNLTTGGKHKLWVAPSQLDVSSLNPAGKRGGCTSRTDETREKMSKRAKELSTPEWCMSRSSSAKDQHYVDKLERFKHCKVDITNMESYIRKKGAKIAVRIDGKKAEFASKHETIEQLKERARAFITDLTQRYQIAGSP